MSRRSESELKPRNGHRLEVGIICRISGCQHQKELSLDDQTDNAKETVADLWSGPVQYTVLASTKAKGERLDRPELELVETAYLSGKYDLLVYDDLSRLIRGGGAARLLGVGVDHGTRSICIGDGIDTIDDTWEEDALNACSENVAHNARTSKRIKQKSMNRFKKLGAALSRPIAGYLVPEGAKTYDDWGKDPLCDPKANPEADPWIYDGKNMLLETGNKTAVADMFNVRGIPTGPYCRRHDWTSAMVGRFYSNTLLKGLPLRGKMHSIKIHTTGVRKSVKNPTGPTYYEAPHLAYFEPVEFDALQAFLTTRNARHARPKVNGQDRRLGMPRKRTSFPGQHGRCWYCGCHHVWGGNGVTKNLMCSNARQWQCWNSYSYSGELAVTRLMEELTRELYQLEGFDEQYRELVEHAGRNDRSDVTRRWERLQSDERDWTRKRQNFVDAIAKVGMKPMFEDSMKEIETEELRLRGERHALERIGQERLDVPESLMTLRQMLEQEFVGAAQDSPVFGDLLRKLCPEFYVYLVRLCDGGHLLPRARVRLALDGVIRDSALVPGLDGLLSRALTIDLFEPPQRERIRAEAVRWSREGLGPTAIAERIAEKPTSTAVQNALALDKRMRELGLTTPYVLVTESPSDYPKRRRHKNPKYRFKTLEGYVPPPLT